MFTGISLVATLKTTYVQTKIRENAVMLESKTSKKTVAKQLNTS